MSTTPDSKLESWGELPEPLKRSKYALISTRWGVPLALLAECFPACLTSKEVEIAKGLLSDSSDNKGGNDAMGVQGNRNRI